MSCKCGNPNCDGTVCQCDNCSCETKSPAMVKPFDELILEKQKKQQELLDDSIVIYKKANGKWETIIPDREGDQI